MHGQYVSYAKGTNMINHINLCEGLQHIHSRKIFHRDEAWIKLRLRCELFLVVKMWALTKGVVPTGDSFTCLHSLQTHNSFGHLAVQKRTVDFDSASRFWLAWYRFHGLLFLWRFLARAFCTSFCHTTSQIGCHAHRFGANPQRPRNKAAFILYRNQELTWIQI